MAPGKTLIKVAGIVLVIFGILGFITGLVTIGGGAYIVNAIGIAGIGLMGGIAILLGIFVVIASILNIIFGILGIRNCDKPKKAGMIFVLGVVMVILTTIQFVLGIVVSGFEYTSIISLAIGLVLPVLYIVGANQNKQARRY